MACGPTLRSRCLLSLTGVGQKEARDRGFSGAGHPTAVSLRDSRKTRSEGHGRNAGQSEDCRRSYQNSGPLQRPALWTMSQPKRNWLRIRCQGR